MSGQVRTDGLAFRRSTLQQLGGLAQSLQVQWLYPKKLRVRANRPQSDLGLSAENDKTGQCDRCCTCFARSGKNYRVRRLKRGWRNGYELFSS